MSSDRQDSKSPFDVGDVKHVNLELQSSLDNKMIMSSDEDASRKFGRSMPKKEEENYLNLLRGMFVFAIMCCVLLEIYAWYTSRLASSWCLMALAVISILMIAVCLHGAIGCYRAVMDLRAPKDSPPIEGKSGQEIFLHSIYFLIPVLAMYCVAGTAALLFPDEVVAY